MKTQKRVTLRGFADSERPAATRTLTDAGYTLVSTVTACDMVVVGSQGWSQSGNLSNDRATAVVPFADLLQNLRHAEREPTDGAFPKRPIIEHHDLRRARVLGIDIDLHPSSRRGIPANGRFDRICLDRPFLQAVRAVALGVANALPTALEGATAASKTTVVLWLAQRLGQPLVRVNLNGQTDTSELIGRYVPATGPDEAWDVAGLARLERFLKPASRELIQAALREDRPLDWAESALVAAAEGIPRARWRFQEGVIPAALRDGAWVLLDEMNLGEPQILERLNPALELPPTLHLSEGDGTVFGSGGVPVHPDFRLFAAMNPSEYAGRSRLSPAFMDRWVNWFQAQTPGEAEYLAQLRFLVFGTQPVVVLDGYTYQGEASDAPVAGNLRRVPDIDTLLAALASCQASLANGTTSSRRRELTVFTRRSLNALVDLWDRRCTSMEPRPALQTSLRDLYWNRIADPGERKAAIGLGEAAGLPVEK